MITTIYPKSLKGNIGAPPSKSITHRALIAASLSKGWSKIENVLESQDILATSGAMVDFGATINRHDTWVDIFSKGQLQQPKHPVNCRESGSTLRFLAPFGALVEDPVVFNGDGKLKTRPMDDYFKIFEEKHVRFAYNEGLPLVVEGQLTAGNYSVKGNVSSQFISGLMLSLPLVEGDSEIIVTTPLESKGYTDLTIDVLSHFGVKIDRVNDQHYRIKGNQKYKRADFRVEGDYSQAAFWIVAGLIGSVVQIDGLNMDSVQGDKKIIDIVKSMNGKIQVEGQRVIAKRSETFGTVIDGSQCPDLIPILTVLAAVSNGKTEIINASRLRLKESDRLKAIASELNKLGAQIIENEDGLTIFGHEHLEGGIVDSWNDHRIAMSLAIASIRCKEMVTITNSHAIEKSYPHFFEDFKKLGGIIIE